MNIKTDCQICGNTYKHLGSHIWHKHKIKAKDYKKRFELSYNQSLISNEVKKKKQKAFNKRADVYLKNLKTKKAKKYRFKKGEVPKKKYISKQSLTESTKRIIHVNKNRKTEKCPVCGNIYNNLTSHLYNKHKLIKL